MKKIFLFSCCSLLLNILSAQTATNDFSRLNWLEGEWIRTNAKPGRSGSERWIKISSVELQGYGVSMKGTDTAFVEKLKIILQNDSIYYVADVAENKGLVYFPFTTITENSFICENPGHDFPKKILYEVNGNKLKAIVSGNGKSIEYLFEKKQE